MILSWPHDPFSAPGSWTTSLQRSTSLAVRGGVSPTAVPMCAEQVVRGDSGQVRECATAFLHASKRSGIPVVLVGHVTKQGDIAGPRVLEHIVDVVLFLESEGHQGHRILRGIKNRYGSTDEVRVCGDTLGYPLLADISIYVRIPDVLRS
jgi:hypothetical protein